MGRHTAYDNLESAVRVDMISDILVGMDIAHLVVLNTLIEGNIKTRTSNVLNMRKRNHERRVRRYRKRVHLAEESEDVSEDSEHSDDGWVSGVDEQSDDEDYENEEYAAKATKKEAT